MEHKSICENSFNSGCPYCAGKRPIKGETDLATMHPELIIDWDFEKTRRIQMNILQNQIKEYGGDANWNIVTKQK